MNAFLVAALLLSQAAAPRQPSERIGVWTTHGPAGGVVSAVAVDPRDPARLYAGTSFGLFTSGNSGATWTSLPIPVERVYLVVIAPSDPSVLYAATLSPRSFEDPQNILFRSTDAGATWTEIGEVGWPGGFYVAVDPTRALTVYSNLGRSTDGGSTWTALPYPTAGVIVIDPVVPTTLYVSFYATQGVYKSTDGGESWTATGTSEAVLSLLAVDPVEHETVYAGYSSFFRSPDGGATWTQSANFPPSNILSFAIGSGVAPILYAGTESDGVYTSADRGATWSRAAQLRGDIRSLSVANREGTDEVLAGTSRRGVFLSIDSGASWLARSLPTKNAMVQSISVSASNPQRVNALACGFARSDDGGATWTVDAQTPVALDGPLAVDPSNPDIIYAAAETAGVLRSADGGATWAATYPTAKPVLSIAIDPKTPTTLYMADGWPLRSLDSGGTWSVINFGIAYGVSLIAVDPLDPSTLYASNGALYRSKDSGASWSLVLSRDLSQGVLSIAADPARPGVVYAGTNSGLQRSDDQGATWSVSFPDQYYAAISSIVLDAGGGLYAAVFSTVPHFLGSSPWRSFDGGRTWAPIGGWTPYLGGFPQFAGPLAVDPLGRRLYVGTLSDSLWQIGLRTTLVVKPR